MNAESVKRGLSKNRLEALTDGIFATVMIVLILNLTGPLATSAASTDLPTLLQTLIPIFFVYLHSFWLLSLLWVGHHVIFYFIKRVDRTLIWLNLLFLLFVGFVPFAAALHGRYFDQLSFTLYVFDISALFISLFVIWSYSTEHHKLVDENLDPEVVRLEKRRMLLGVPFMAAALAFSFASVYLSHGVLTVLGIYLMLPTTRVDASWSETKEPPQL